MNASTPPAVAPARRDAIGFSLAFPLAWADILRMDGCEVLDLKKKKKKKAEIR